ALSVPDRSIPERHPVRVSICHHQPGRHARQAARSRRRHVDGNIQRALGGDALVVDVTGFNGMSWFDRAGNFASDSLRVIERYSPLDANTIHYEATMEDPALFTRPWKISLPLYRHREKNARLLDFKCVEFVEELLYGDLKKK